MLVGTTVVVVLDDGTSGGAGRVVVGVVGGATVVEIVPTPGMRAVTGGPSTGMSDPSSEASGGGVCSQSDPFRGTQFPPHGLGNGA